MKKYVLFLAISVLIGIMACQSNQQTMNLDNFDLQGHRGARGLLPENTIPSFLKALEYDVMTLEMDVVISKDKQVIVSHEGWFSSEICTKPNGDSISTEEGKSLLIYNMDYAEIKQYDCGKKGNARFPEQKPMPTHKPTFNEVVKAVQAYEKANNIQPIRYNIEIKSELGKDSILQPEPKEFTQLLYDELKRLNVLELCTVQSFDVRPLQVLHALDSTATIALLVYDENGGDFDKNIAALGFTPPIYSPYFVLVNEELIKKTRAKGMKVVPWTVNTKEAMKHMIEVGVDGLITDYPNLGREVLNEMKK